MTVWDWLGTSSGIELTHAVVLLVTSLAAWFAYRAHRGVSEATDRISEQQADLQEVKDKIDGHLNGLSKLE